MITEQNPNGLKTHKNNPCIKAHNAKQTYTQEELVEYIKCKNNIVYFVEKYAKFFTVDNGFVNVKLRKYQKKFLKHVSSNRFTLGVWPRQSAKSTTSVMYILHTVIFNPDQSWFILANKRDTALEIFSRLIDCYSSLPFFLQQGVKEFNKSSILLSNGSKVKAAATSTSAIRGQSCNGILLDEFAFVPRDREFFTSVFPVVSSGSQSKVIIVSTPNGMNNLFYDIYRDCLSDRGEFTLMQIAWDDVPGRNEKWRKEMIATIGRKAFDQEYSCSFLGNEGTLIPLEYLERIDIREPLIAKESLCVYEKVIKNHIYALIVDVSRGSGIDNSAFSVIDITKKPYKQVCVYYDNEIAPMMFPYIIDRVGKNYNDAFVLIEINDAGCQVADILAYDLEYENILWVGSSGREQTLGGGTGAKPGVRTTRSVKSVGCSNLKLLMEQGFLEIYDKNTFSEMSAFIAKKGSYQADNGAHDDIVMTLVLFAWAIEQSYMSDLLNISTRQSMIEYKLSKLEDDLLPFGFIVDGKEDAYSAQPPVIDYTNIPIPNEDRWLI